MALVLKDRVKETSTTTGTGTFTLAGASTGYQSFSVIGNGNTTYYAIALQGGSEWEVGIGTYTSSGTTLARTTVLASSNSGSAVNFSAGTKDVFVTMPADKSVIGDAGTVAIANGGTGQTTATLAFNALAPSQTSNSGKYLTTDGTNTSWGTISASMVYPSAGVAVSTGTAWGTSLTATSANTASAIVQRDASGNFSAGTITAALSGNATTAGGFTPSQTNGVASRIVVADGSGYINNNYFNSTDDVSGASISYVMAKFGDNYYRSATAAKVATFISGQSMNIAGTATNATNILGNSQTWQTVTRTLGTTYTNSTGKPIALCIYTGSVNTAGVCTITVGGATSSSDYTAGASAIGYAVIPIGATYSITFSGSLASYSVYELR